MKKSIIPVAAFIAGMAIVPSVFALEVAETPITDAGLLEECFNNEKLDTCTIANNINIKTKNFSITKNKTLNLDGNTITILSDYTPEANPFEVKADATSTITGGTIKNEKTDKQIVNVAKGGTLVVTEGTMLEGWNPVVTNEPKQVTINGELKGGDSYALRAAGSTEFAGAASVIEVAGRLSTTANTATAYYQTGNVNATISGIVSSTGTGNAMYTDGGVLTLDHARVNINTNGSALVLAGAGKVTIKGCSELTSTNGAALYIADGAKVEALTIENNSL